MIRCQRKKECDQLQRQVEVPESFTPSDSKKECDHCQTWRESWSPNPRVSTALRPRAGFQKALYDRERNRH